MKIFINNKIPVRALPEFRFWHIGRQRMYVIDNITRDGQITWWPGPDATLQDWDTPCSDGMDVEDGVLMQFTGLVDSSGAKVWEGDILYQTYKTKDVKGGTIHSYTIVVFAHGGFGLVSCRFDDVESFNFESCLSDTDPIDARIVGNVYMHADLLARDYDTPVDSLCPGAPPDNFDYDPESIYTFCSKSSIGTIDEHSDVSPSGTNVTAGATLNSLLSYNG